MKDPKTHLDSLSLVQLTRAELLFSDRMQSSLYLILDHSSSRQFDLLTPPLFIQFLPHEIP